jgi:formate hydrogenlyase subunit 4
MTAALEILAQVAALLALSPLLSGAIRKIEAAFMGRAGPPVLQGYYDIMKLLRKEIVIPEPASPLFALAPYAVFGLTCAAAALVPVLRPAAPLGGAGDALALVGLLAAARFLMALGGLEPGTAFGGMGSAREMAFGALIEPALLLAIYAAAIAAGATDPGALAQAAASPSAPRLLALCAFALAALAEAGRIPVDNPFTHFELTMMHEGMFLDHAGPHAALYHWSAHLKQLVLMTLLIDLFVPWGLQSALPLSIVAYALKLTVLVAAIAVTEIAVAKLRLYRIPEVVGASAVFSLLALSAGLA